jgi:hypothetical protein
VDALKPDQQTNQAPTPKTNGESTPRPANAFSWLPTVCQLGCDAGGNSNSEAIYDMGERSLHITDVGSKIGVVEHCRKAGPTGSTNKACAKVSECRTGKPKRDPTAKKGGKEKIARTGTDEGWILDDLFVSWCTRIISRWDLRSGSLDVPRCVRAADLEVLSTFLQIVKVHRN